MYVNVIALEKFFLVLATYWNTVEDCTVYLKICY